MEPRNDLERVELLNVPHYRQGDFDGLCAYYAGAMMLASLYPRFSMQFGELLAKRGTRGRALDPMIRHYAGEYRKAGPGKDDRYILARIFYEGQFVRDVGKTLNNVMKHANEATRFRFSNRAVSDRTFYAIAESIDKGLPVLIGWETADYGNHAVLIRGYWHGDDDWLLLNDPGGDTRMSWQVLRSAVEAKLEFVRCNPETHAGPRPDKALTTTGGTVEIHRWVPQGGYVSLEQHFRDD